MKVTIGSKTYECEKFGLTEFADLQDWMQERREDRIAKRAQKLYGDDPPNIVFTELNKEITIDIIEEALESDIRAIGYLIFLTVHKTNPSVTFDEIMNELGDMDGAIKAMACFTPKAVPKKKKTKRKKRPTKKS